MARDQTTLTQQPGRKAAETTIHRRRFASSAGHFFRGSFKTNELTEELGAVRDPLIDFGLDADESVST